MRSPPGVTVGTGAVERIDSGGIQAELTSQIQEVGSAADRVILQGFVNSRTNDSIEVLGVTATIDMSTECRQADDTAYPGGCSALLTDLVDNQTIVKVRGAIGASYDSVTRTLTAEQVEVEIHDN